MTAATHTPVPTADVRIEVFSDVVCPWCFIGKRRLEEALRRLAAAAPASVPPRVEWQLCSHPSPPPNRHDAWRAPALWPRSWPVTR